MMPYFEIEFKPTTRCLDCGVKFQEAKDNTGLDYCPSCRLVHSLDRLIEVLEMIR
jgi:Zn-finger nucleic acid-binding protein